MFSFASEQERARPLIVLGMIGSLAAIASFFFLPAALSGMFGGTPVHLSAWYIWQGLASSDAPEAPVLLIAIALVPACAFVALLIGCAGLFRPLPRLLMRAFTLVTFTGLGLLCVSFLLILGLLAPDLGYFGMLAGYICIAFERGALSQARKGT